MGIIYAQQSMAIGDIIREVLRIHKDMDADAMKNNVKYL
jgi:hypothetical protein